MKDNIVIILIETIDPANIGAVARGMYNFGFDKLRLVNTADHKSKRAYDLACNAKTVVDKAKTFNNFNDAISDCTYVIGFTRRIGSHRIPKAWDSFATIVNSRLKMKDKIALVFGREDTGLSSKETDLCHELSVIKTDKKCPSINLAQAVTLVVYELAKLKNIKLEIPKQFTADAKKTNKTLGDFETLLIELGYDDKKLRDKIFRRMKNILGRASSEIADLKMFEGLFGQIKTKIKKHI